MSSQKHMKALHTTSGGSSQEWVQCDDCGKWRKLPIKYDVELLKGRWVCSMNSWDGRNNCKIPEEKAQSQKPRGRHAPVTLENCVDLYLERRVCPICGDCVQDIKYFEHFNQELARIRAVDTVGPDGSRARRGASVNAKRKLQGMVVMSHHDDALQVGENDVPEQVKYELERARQVLRDAQANRAARSGAKSRGSRRRPSEAEENEDEHVCPVCFEEIPADEIAASEHVDMCLRRQGRGGEAPAEEAPMVEAEEYEWAGQKRIRVSSILEKGYAGLGFAVSRPCADDEDSEDIVNVDGDDDNGQFGPGQFGEEELVHVDVTEGSAASQKEAGDKKASDKDDEDGSDLSIGGSSDAARGPPDDIAGASHGGHVHGESGLVVEALRSRIREQESMLSSAPKCRICLLGYKEPVVSVNCWHIHCFDCWMRTLGAKRLCPQCMAITGPSDLRKVYL